MITRRAFIASTATTGAALALAACAPAPSPSASSATSATPGASTKTTWTVALDFKINAIDLGITDEWRGVIGHFYEPLVDTVGFDFQLVPRLATSWERTDDVTWRFHLRQGIKFHDGKEMTADDVDYSVRAYAEPTHPMNYRVPWFVQSKVVD
jgi:peptide/nickel transport system substrate-binding protein